jgi:hypothetical protein
MIKKYLVFALVLSVAATAWAGATTSKRADASHKTPVVGQALEQINVPVAQVRNPGHQSLDVIGEQYVAGTTYYDYQHNGTVGRMIGVDEMGFVHCAWMNGTTEELGGPRDAYYNCWDPSTGDWQELIPDGGVAANTVRAGYVSNAVLPNGFSFPAFHSTGAGDAVLSTHTAIDFQGHAGAFTPFAIGPFGADQVLWPKITIDDDGTLHGVSTSDPDTDQGYHYWKATPQYDVSGGQTFGISVDYTTFNNGSRYQVLGTSEVIAPDVAASPISDRVAVVFNDSRGGPEGTAITQWNNDVVIVISEDGGMNFAPPINLTDWIDPDMNCATQDTIACNGDTLRAYTCLDIEFDDADNIHVAFTTRPVFFYGTRESVTIPDTTGYYNLSSIWHWSEETDEFSCIVNHNQFAWFSDGDSILQDNAWQLMVQRPSMAWDQRTGMMYCSYIQHDSTQYDANYFMSADIMLTASCNNGRTWFNPINLTNTVTPVGSQCGEAFHERDQSLNKYVTYDGDNGYLHLQYVLDKGVGGIAQTEGCATLNNVYYQRIPLADLPDWGGVENMIDWTTPSLHVDQRQAVGSGVVPFDPQDPCAGVGVGRQGSVPTAFQLFQNYPNPFNPTTNIQFDLVNASQVSLKIFNVLGEVVATLVDGEALSAGAHTYSFDGASLASGVYMYRLEANGISSTRKMVLMK